MNSTRRGFFGALLALPVIRALVPARETYAKMYYSKGEVVQWDKIQEVYMGQGGSWRRINDGPWEPCDLERYTASEMRVWHWPTKSVKTYRSVDR